MSYGRLKICEITRVCLENNWSVTGRQSVFFPYKSGLLISKIFKIPSSKSWKFALLYCKLFFPFLRTLRDQLCRAWLFQNCFLAVDCNNYNLIEKQTNDRISSTADRNTLSRQLMWKLTHFKSNRTKPITDRIYKAHINIKAYNLSVKISLTRHY